MQRIEHEFEGDDNQAIMRLSEGLYRFSIMVGVVGLALIGLGVAVIRTGGYASTLAGPVIIVLGLIAMGGGVLFLRPRVSFANITRTRGGDVTKLMDALKFLDTAHGGFRILIAAFVIVRLAAYLIIRLS